MWVRLGNSGQRLKKGLGDAEDDTTATQKTSVEDEVKAVKVNDVQDAEFKEVKDKDKPTA
ncbi:Sec-independent protein translocase subunit TatA [Oligella ureolytica]